MWLYTGGGVLPGLKKVLSRAKKATGIYGIRKIKPQRTTKFLMGTNPFSLSSPAEAEV